jgi:hypothetical protein
MINSTHKPLRILALVRGDLKRLPLVKVARRIEIDRRAQASNRQRERAMKQLFLVFFLVLSALGARTAHARPQAPVIADPLKAWVPWLLDAQRDLLCAGLGDARTCEWPGHLQVQIDDQRGQFTLDVWLDAPGNVALPGDRAAWPLNVLADGKPALVQAMDDHPSVALAAGHHSVVGKLEFGQAPELLAVPDAIGVVELTLGGQKVELPRRDGEGRLFLRGDQAAEHAEQDALTVTIARKVQDGVPLRVVTRLTLRVAGRPRDLVLGNVLLAGARPVTAQSDLPMQIAGDGALRVHGRPGEHTVDIEAVQLGDAAPLTVPTIALTGAEPQETWVWVPDETLRSVELSGLAPIDPDRTQLADDWKHAGRCYVATPGQMLTFKESRRGETEPPPSRLQLSRELWLDLDGNELTARDRFTGDLRTGWRLDVAPGIALGHVTIPGQANALLITEQPETKHLGVELRDGNLKLEADSRFPLGPGAWPGLRALHVVGWLVDVQQLDATLHLPPGWKLLGVSGVDRPPENWLDSWTLFDFFFVLMVAAAAGKLLGKRWGLLALVALGLCHGEADAPQVLWLNVLLALALARAVTAGKLGMVVKLWHGAAVVALVLAVVPFARDQVREGLYPQVAQSGKAPLAAGGYEADKDAWALGMAKAEAPAQAFREGETDASEVAGAAPEPKEEAKPDAPKPLSRSILKLGLASTPGYDATTQQQMRQLDPGAVVQTGPGVPKWRWTELALKWSGPVRQDHEIQLLLLSPAVQLILALLRVLLVVILALRLMDRAKLRALAGQLGALALLLAVSSVVQPRPALANEFPPQPLLDELTKKLVAAETCDGPCMVVSDLRLTVQGQRVTATAEVSAQRDTGWGLPGPWDPLQVSEVRVDGQPTRALRRLPGGLIAVRVPAGAHTIAIDGQLVRRSVVTLQLDPQALPRHIAVHSQDWTADALQPGQVKDSLQLTRIVGLPGAQTATEGDAESLELPPWFHVERHLLLGLPWQVHTTVTREKPGRAEVLKLPLLAGERVITDGVTVEAGAAVLHFGREDLEASFDAELPVAPRLTLTAPPLQKQAWTETWRLDCSQMWRCTAKGVPPVHTRDPQSAQLQPVWQPWPGETLQIDVQKPLGAKGPAVTIDAAHYVVTPGQRLLEATLTLTIRTSQGGTQTLTLPEGAQVQSVAWGTAGNDARAIRPLGRKLALPLDPGEQVVTIKWQQPWQRSAHEVVPPLDLGGPAVNVQTTLNLGEDRWLLWAHGPKWGPAVLFWSHLLLLLLAAALLGRLHGLPLKTRHWLLLGLGLVQVPPVMLLLVVAWFAAFAWRQRRAPHEEGKPVALLNLAQIALVGLTVAFFAVLYWAIQENLLGSVDMQVSGAGSSGATLTWYVDRVESALPEPGICSLPLLAWRIGMLLWALWLVSALLRWLPWAWRAFATGGLWWKAPPRKPPGPKTPIVRQSVAQSTPVPQAGVAESPGE